MVSRVPPIRIAMWSGPRNISTAMMRAFENRGDCAVSDEPFYAAYLVATGLRHPMREDVVASQPTDARAVAEALVGPSPEGKPIWYQKHMTHHMVAGFGREWIDACVNAFLIRKPEAVLASYARKRESFSLDEIGLPAQVDTLRPRRRSPRPRPSGRRGPGRPRRSRRACCARLCRACGIGFDAAMLAWPAGPRASDGVWAPVWYESVEKSTGFAPPRDEAGFDELPDALKRIAEAARPLYENLARHKLTPLGG